MESTLKQFKDQIRPGNNSREIVKELEKKLIKMRDFPSEARARELEMKWGIVCDFQTSDFGEPPFQKDIEE